jgi:hypothetical protein
LFGGSYRLRNCFAAMPQRAADQAATWVLNGKGRFLEAMAYRNQLLRDLQNDESKKVAEVLSLVRRQIAERAVRNEVSLKRDDGSDE